MGTITVGIGKAGKEFSRNLYFYEDFERLIEELRESIAQKATDREPTLRSSIEKMFSALGIDCAEQCTPEEYYAHLDLADVPGIDAFPNLCLEEICKLNKAYKSPKEYMERLVAKLGDPQYNTPDAPLKVRILRHILGRMNYLEGTRFFDNEKSEVKTSRSKKSKDTNSEKRNLKKIIDEEYGGIIADIDERIFDKYLLKTHYITAPRHVEVMLGVYGDDLYYPCEKDEKLASLLSEYEGSCKDMTACELVEFIKANNQLVTTDDKGRSKKIYPINEYNGRLMVLIEEHIEEVVDKYKKEKYKNDYQKEVESIKEIKRNRGEQFERIMDFVSRRGLFDVLVTRDIKGIDDFAKVVKEKTRIDVSKVQTAEELREKLSQRAKDRPVSFSVINENLFSRLNKYLTLQNQKYKSGKDNAKEKTEDNEVLRLCDVLASGQFRNNSEMKEYMYLFAFAFGMCVKKVEDNPYRDIEKNLFEDFYCDNILRYLDKESRIKSGGADEPSGVTIQYKNFAEAVYLYWLNRSCKNSLGDDMTPYEKYLEARKMIKDIVSGYKEAKDIVERAKDKMSEEYRRANTIVQKKKKGTFVYRAYFKGEELLRDKTASLLEMDEKEFKDFILENYDIDVNIDYTGTGAFENESYQGEAKETFEWMVKKAKDYDLERSPIKVDFCQFAKEEFTEDAQCEENPHKQLADLVKKINAQLTKVRNDARAGSCGDLTRTRYMYLYFLCFVMSRLDDADKGSYCETFEDFYSEYTTELDDGLQNCAYQLFSEKNLIDMMLLYSAFIILRFETEDE